MTLLFACRNAAACHGGPARGRTKRQPLYTSSIKIGADGCNGRARREGRDPGAARLGPDGGPGQPARAPDGSAQHERPGARCLSYALALSPVEAWAISVGQVEPSGIWASPLAMSSGIASSDFMSSLTVTSS